jgi:hypothetical protein
MFKSGMIFAGMTLVLKRITFIQHSQRQKIKPAAAVTTKPLFKPQAN